MEEETKVEEMEMEMKKNIFFFEFNRNKLTRGLV